MTKIDVFSLPRPPFKTETKSFSDPLAPGKLATITLTAVGAMDQGRINDLAERMVAKYIGDEITPAQCPFPPVGGKTVLLSATMSYMVASMVVMQEDAPEGADVWSFEELVALGLTLPTAWIGMAQFRSRVAMEGLIAQGEGAGEGTGTASNSLPDTTPLIPS